MIRRNAHSSDPALAPNPSSPPAEIHSSSSRALESSNATVDDVSSKKMQKAPLLRSPTQSMKAPVTQLDSLPPALDFPTDFPRSSAPLPRRAWRDRKLSRASFDGIQSLRSDSPEHAENWLLAAWASLIYRYTSSDDFAIGRIAYSGPFDGTSDSGHTDRSRIACRFQLRDDTTANTVVNALADVVSIQTRSCDGVYDPLLDTACSPSELPIQVVFVHPFKTDPSIPNESNAIEDDATQCWYPQTELQVTFGLSDGTVRVDYLTSLWRPEFIGRMLEHFETLLTSMLNAPNVSISKQRLLTDAEWNQIVVQWNCNATPFPLDRSVHGLIVEQSLRTPDAIAVVCEDQSLTYRELDEKSDRLASHLQTLGIAPGALVGLSIEQSSHVLVAILGILKAGAAYVPLDIKHPADRLQSIVQDAGLEIVVTSTQLAPRLPIATDQTVLLDAMLQSSGNYPASERFHAQVTPAHLAYVLYTSGTTGKPKGVAIPHRAVVNFLCAMAIRPGMKPGERLLSITSPSFDISVLEMLLPLVVGATVEVVPAQHIKDPAALAEALQRSRAQMMQATPTTWQMMVLHGWNGHPNLKLITGGEALSDALAAQLMERCDELWNQYGPTETTVYMTQYLVPPGGPNRNIGKPIANCQVYILDPHGNPVPVGVPGEIFVGGEPLARGYLHRDDLTAEKFIRNPFTNDPNARIYQTGDLGRWTVDGDIQCLGRIDHQVKLRGYRIELKEIESWLNQWPGIRESVVRLREDTPGDPRLVAYCVFPEMTRPNATEVVAYLHQKLPEYMVPSDFVWLEHLPLTVNGKIDVKALPKPDRGNRERAEQHVAPRTPLETLIAEVFQSILGVAQIGIHDSFFALGGHSLSAVRAIVRIRDHSVYPIRVRMLFEHPTVEQLASYLGNTFGPYPNPAQPTAVPVIPHASIGDLAIATPPSDFAPLSFAQMRLWLVDEIENGTNAYNIPRAYQLRGPLDTVALARAIERLIERHEPLRTTFRVVDGSPVQCVLAPPGLDLEIESLEDVPTDCMREAIQLRFEQIADERFHLAHDIPFRARLLRISPQHQVLITNTHHIASDEWSVDVFNAELSTAYREALHGQSCSLPSLPTRYIDYAVQQRRELSGTHYDSMLEYWKSQLQGMPTLDVPHDFPRPYRPTYACGQERMQFDPELVARLHSIARESQCTLHMVFLAAFQCLLQKWSKQDDICVGMPIAGRMHEELEPLIGFFVNTLVIRGDLSGNPTFCELLQRVRATSLAAYDHQEMPFEKLVEELQPERTFNSNPLVQVLFQLTNFTPSALNLEGLTAEPLDLNEPRLRFDLEVYVTQNENSLTGSIHFARELFEPETIARFAQQYLALLESIAAAPEKPISDLDWISQRDTQRVLIEWNDTHAATPDYANITQWIDAQTDQSPDAIAVEFSGEQLSYRQLKLRSQSIALAIANACATAPRRVGIMMDRSIDLIAGILGILRAGAAVVPIDPAYPESRRQFILTDAKIDLLLTNAGMPQSQMEGSAPVLHTDALTELDRKAATFEFQFQITTPTDPVYILYTSGSTGQPKGVEMPHRAMLNLVQWHRSVPRLQLPARTLQFATCNFDVSFQEILTTLCTGGTLVLVSEDIRRDPDELWRYLASHRVQRIFVPFVMLQQLATACNESAREVDTPSLQDIVSAGEALLFTPELQHLLARLPDCRLHNHYGPTETHVITSHLVSDHELRSLRESPIGKPISNSQVYVLDAQRRPLPPGIPGDLWLAGDCLAHGYVDRPELTDSRFMEVTLPLVGSKRMYQSGDLARWNNRGELLYLGRSDDQVKHRGVRIELGEIEARLLEHPAVAQAAVAIQSAPDGLQRLCAYYVLREGGTTTHGDLQTFLRERLPDAMVPNAWASMDSLPLTASGKLNRRALPIAIAWQEESMEHVPPSTPTEIALAEIWMELLSAERVGSTDNFFALGGHSLLAARMRSRLMQKMGCSIPLRQIFQYPVLRDLANSLDAIPSGVATSVRNERILPAGAMRGPLSCSQARLWFLESLSGGVSTTYNLNYAFKLLGTLDPKSLRACFEELIARHQILRTRYGQEDGEIYQEVLDAVPIDWYEENLVNVSLEDAFRRSESIVFARSQDVFDLTRGEVVRATLVKCAPDVHVFSITIHHIAFDGGSIGIFLKELSESYHRRRHGRSMQPRDASLQYLDYSIWQRSELTKPSIQESLEFWKTALNGLQPLELPKDTSRPDAASNRGDSVPLHFDRDLVTTLKQIGRSCNATLQMTLMASFQLLLGRIARTDDLAVGTATANRNLPQLEQLIGFTANTVLVRTQLDWNTTFRDLLQQVQRTSLDVYAHEDLPFDFLVEHLHPERSANRLPLVQALLQVLPSETHTLQLPGITVSEFPIGVTSSRFELEAHLWEHREELDGFLVYSTDLFGRARMQALADRWSSLIHQIAQNPDRKLGEFSLLLPDERVPLLLECNQTQRDLPTGSVVDVFQNVAERYGEKIAMIAGENSWSYAALNRASDRWAEELRQRGVRSGDSVAMLLPRSPKMIVAMLAILKAGGCYVPLSTDDPPPRLATLLQRSQAVIVLTDDEHSVPLPQVEIPVLAMHSWEPQAISASGNKNGPASMRCQTGPEPEDLAYVLFTSGSTGEPKGVCVEHRSILRLVFGNDFAKLGPDRVLLHLAPAAFDAATFEVWGALLHGATLVLAPPDRVLDLATIGSLIQHHRITTLWLTATLFNQWVEEAPESLRGVEEILTGGEALSVQHIHMAQQRLGPHVQLINGYGPTECTTFATCYRIPFPLEERVRSIPIGRPIGNTMAWVVDERLNLVPPGTIGELLLGGMGLARGYLANDALTQTRFIPAPWPEYAGQRAYRTGDLVRWNQEGNLEFIGRTDEQVKLRGFRIELGEIESQLMAHPEVQRCVVHVTQDSHHLATLAAYIVPSDATTFAPHRVRDHLRERLPSYMIPSAFVSIDHIPIKENGKVDVNGLPPIDPDALIDTIEAIPPRNETERQMLELWFDVLGKTGFGVMDDFFDLGGHSLLAVKLFAKIEKHFGVKIPLAFLFQHATVAQLVSQLSKASNSEKWVELVPLSATFSDHPLYLLPSLGGELLHLRPLVDAIGNSIPMVGLQPILSDEYVSLSRDLRATAATYVDAIQSHQPQGPYRLGGFSYGGMLAFEVARQLSQNGHSVDYLAIIDTGPCWDGQPMRFPDKLAWSTAVIRNFPGWLACEWQHTPWSVIVSSAKRKTRFAFRWLSSLGKASTTYDDIFESPRIASRDASIMRACFEAFAKYTSDRSAATITHQGKYAGPVQVFRTRTQSLLSGAQADLGWSRWGESVSIHVLPGNHEMVFSPPSVVALAKEIERGLKRLDIPSEHPRRT